MLATHRKASALECRPFEANEQPELIRFFREAGFPVPIHTKDMGWGVRVHGRLIGCIALCHEGKTWILRGPEVLPTNRRRGVGAELIRCVLPSLADRDCYCVAYPNLLKLYQGFGFRPCATTEQPAFLRRRVAWLRETGWELTVLRRPAG